MMRNSKPIYLLGDSRLLFTDNSEGKPVFSDIPPLFQKDNIPVHQLKAAYIGASNGDNPAFFELFKEAMARLSIENCRFISADFAEESISFLRSADVIMLAGGDTEAGWKAMQDNEIPLLLIECYNQGAILMGVSAGAIQLGWQLFGEDENGDLKFTEALKLAPFLVSAHEDTPDWPLLQQLVTNSRSMSRGIGIPYGGALVYYPDGEVEVRGNAATEIIFKDGSLHTSLLT